jgi:5-methylcytosine-specific restriction protein A
MSSGVNSVRLGRSLQERLGLALIAKDEVVDGGLFATLRPSDLEEGNGFVIVVSRTARQVEASFRADSFAAALLRKMSEADALARGTFHALLSQARSDCGHVYLEVDGASVESLPDSAEPWRSFGLDMSTRLPPGKVTEGVIQEEALRVASACMTLALSLLPVEPMQEPGLHGAAGLPEGARTRVEVNRYERSPVNRAACIAHYGPICRACAFDFRAFYGSLGEGYVEVHHRTPVSRMNESYFVNPITDLVPVCANCHAMLHRTEPPMAVEALRTLLGERRASAAVNESAASARPL